MVMFNDKRCMLKLKTKDKIPVIIKCTSNRYRCTRIDFNRHQRLCIFKNMYNLWAFLYIFTMKISILCFRERIKFANLCKL